ncbi:MAG: gluconate 2-dehydrogenase subunit 3 family protein [Longimicrobiales bacterium]
MNRRDALRGISVLLGTAITPKVARAVHAGYTAPPLGQPLRTFDRRQRELVATLAELIIPTTDTPGARAARVDVFIDGLLTDIFTPGERDEFLEGLSSTDAHARAAYGVSILECAPPQQVEVLATLEREAREADDGSRAFFPWLKELTLVGYYTSEIGASQELSYVHVAGSYDGDIPYAQIGRAHS